MVVEKAVPTFGRIDCSSLPVFPSCFIINLLYARRVCTSYDVKCQIKAKSGQVCQYLWQCT